MPARSVRYFLKALQSVPFAQIQEEAHLPFSMAVVGRPEERQDALRFLFPDARDLCVLPARSLVQEFRSIAPGQAPGFDIIVVATADSPELLPAPNAYHLAHLGHWPRLFERILQDRPDLAASCARRFPGLRPMVSKEIITQTARTNAQFAFTTSLPQLMPFAEIFVPATALADVFIITRNQAEMLLRLAAIYDLPTTPTARIQDAAPLVGNAVGWRALSRMATSLIPGGIGVVANALFAYAGTVTVGRALEIYYRTGIRPDAAAIKQLFRTALGEARWFVTQNPLSRRRR